MTDARDAYSPPTPPAEGGGGGLARPGPMQCNVDQRLAASSRRAHSATRPERCPSSWIDGKPRWGARYPLPRLGRHALSRSRAACEHSACPGQGPSGSIAIVDSSRLHELPSSRAEVRHPMPRCPFRLPGVEFKAGPRQLAAKRPRHGRRSQGKKVPSLRGLPRTCVKLRC